MKKIKFKTLNNNIPRYVLKTADVLRSKNGIFETVGKQILSSTLDKDRAIELPFSTQQELERFYQTDEVTFLE